MTPIEYYHRQKQQHLIIEDAEQLRVLAYLQAVYLNLVRERQNRKRFYAVLRKPKLVAGLYLWGGVGVGKTFVMDCFYHSLPFPEKMRIHFHQFMQMIHRELARYQGEKNPLDKVAKELSKQAMVLCFDELHVSDIADAMILAHLFHALKTYGVTIVTTSNVMPDDLYLRGLQRPLFLPAIDLLKKITKVMHVPTTTDYRLQHLKHAGAFYTPMDEIADQNMEKCFVLLSEGCSVSQAEIMMCDRPIQIVKEAGDTIWFDFDVICAVPRSQNDYLAIANQYKTVMISGVRKISPGEKNTIRLFVRMIDVFYDARIRLVCASTIGVDDIYTSGDMIFEYARTRSRLNEMLFWLI